MYLSHVLEHLDQSLFVLWLRPAEEHVAHRQQELLLFDRELEELCPYPSSLRHILIEVRENKRKKKKEKDGKDEEKEKRKKKKEKKRNRIHKFMRGVPKRRSDILLYTNIGNSEELETRLGT